MIFRTTSRDGTSNYRIIAKDGMHVPEWFGIKRKFLFLKIAGWHNFYDLSNRKVRYYSKEEAEECIRVHVSFDAEKAITYI